MYVINLGLIPITRFKPEDSHLIIIHCTLLDINSEEKIMRILFVLIALLGSSMVIAVDYGKLYESVDKDKAVDSVDKGKAIEAVQEQDVKKGYDSVDKGKATDSVDKQKAMEALMK